MGICMYTVTASQYHDPGPGSFVRLTSLVDGAAVHIGNLAGEEQTSAGIFALPTPEYFLFLSLPVQPHNHPLP